MSMSVKLIYFNARGVAEVSRYMLSIAGVEYEDYRYPLGCNYHHPEFDADKATKFDVNMCQIPVLEIDGQQLGQSSTIMRYVARKYGFAGSNDVEAALSDMYCEHVRDIKDAHQKVRWVPKEDEKKAAMEKWFSTELPEWLGKLEKSIVGSGGFAVGTKLSVADLAIYYFLTFFFDNKEGAKAAYAACPKLSAIVAAVGAHAGVKAWEAKRPDSLV